MKAILAILTITLIATGIFIYKDSIVRSENAYFDMFKLEVFWGKTFCIDEYQRKYPARYQSCLQSVTSHAGTGLIIDAFKAANQAMRDDLDHCNTGMPIYPQDDGSEVFQKMNKYWISLDSETTTQEWTEEFNDHGFCISQDPKQYFTKAFQAYDKFNLSSIIPSLVPGSGEVSVPTYDFINRLKSVLGNGFSIDCHYDKYSRKYYLEDLHIYLDLNLNTFAYKSKNDCKGANIIIPY